jgi:O-antigen/teichoic acid export membrane protein
VLNDSTYAVTAIGFLVSVAATGHDVTLGTLVWSMAVGSGAASLAVIAQLPRPELSPPPSGTRADLGGLAGFAVWRAAQVGIRPTAQFLMRVIIAASFSSAALGRLEAARLLLAPVLVVVNGAGFVLLPTYADRVRQGTLSIRSVRTAMVALGLLGVVCGGAALLAAAWVSPLVTGGSFDVDPVAVLSWGLLVAGFGAGIPAGLAVVALGHPRRTFLVRAADSALGLAGVLVFVVVGAPELAPAGLALGTFVGAAWLLRDLRTGGPCRPLSH